MKERLNHAEGALRGLKLHWFRSAKPHIPYGGYPKNVRPYPAGSTKDHRKVYKAPGLRNKILKKEMYSCSNLLRRTGENERWDKIDQ